MLFISDSPFVSLIRSYFIMRMVDLTDMHLLAQLIFSRLSKTSISLNISMNLMTERYINKYPSRH